MQPKIQPIAITAGDPAGIGPDLVLQFANHTQQYPWLVIADPDLMQQRAKLLGLDISIQTYHHNQQTEPGCEAGTLHVQAIPCRTPAIAGQLDPANADYVLETLSAAIRGCQQQHFSAMVTAPIHKGVINDAGIPFSGHTEFLAEQTGAALPVMMLTANTLRVALATTHLPLKEVSTAINKDLLKAIITTLHQDMINKFDIKSPRILVCGLNPHAGEGGHLGHEEIDVIEPVLNQLRKQGLQLTGPLPADTLFTPKYLDHSDAVLAMYHDQGLPVLKHIGFGHAVNITLGLPIIRTSVDHGTALDLAGTGKANIGSLKAAFNAAQSMAATQTNR